MINNKTFYPTPKDLIRKMIYKLDKNKIKHILEPSAGKGDIIKEYENWYKINYGNRHYKESNLIFDAIEIDYNLSSMLRGKGINVVGEDFLNFEPLKYYDLIIMNPPFDHGDKHLLKAIQIQERIGGKIVCLLNSETIKNPFSNNRKHLLSLLEQYNAEIEYIKNAFYIAERKTDVEIACIHINIPMKNTKTMFEREFEKDHVDTSFKEYNTLNCTNKLEALITECELIKKAGENLFKEKMRIDYFMKNMNIKPILHICDNDYKANSLDINEYIEKINLKYWNKFIDETDFKNKLPSKLRNDFHYNMQHQKYIAFNKENVTYFCEQLIGALPGSYEENVAKIFDDLTREYHYSENAWSKSIHYYNGWKTNKAFKINNKVIFPNYSRYYSLSETLVDLNIIFENISGLKDNLYKNEILKDKIANYEKNIETRFFIINSYKKGTLHIKFKDQRYLDQFNILASKGKKWLPSDFGSKSYDNMNTEEKQLLLNFGLTKEEYTSYQNQKNYLRIA